MLSPKVNLFSYFNILYHFKCGNLSSLSAPLHGEIDKCAHWVFYTKLNSQQLFLRVFLHIINIFGSVEQWSQSIFPFSSSMFEFIPQMLLSIRYNAHRRWRHQWKYKSQWSSAFSRFITTISYSYTFGKINVTTKFYNR